MSKIIWQKDGARIVEDEVGNFGLEYLNGKDLMDVEIWKFHSMIKDWEENLIEDYIYEQSKRGT